MNIKLALYEEIQSSDHTMTFIKLCLKNSNNNDRV